MGSTPDITLIWTRDADRFQAFNGCRERLKYPIGRDESAEASDSQLTMDLNSDIEDHFSRSNQTQLVGA